MKKLLLALLLIPSLVFGQATGMVISNKPSGGAIGTAATTVDVATLFNLNQTTAGQTLTVPNLTNASAGKIIYINDVGSATLTLSPGGFLIPGKGVILRWTGSTWSVCGNGHSSLNPTSTYFPYNNGGLFSDSWLYQIADSIKITEGKLFTSPNGRARLYLRNTFSSIGFDDGVQNGEVLSNNSGTFLSHSQLIRIESGGDVEIEAPAGNVTITGNGGLGLTATSGVVVVNGIEIQATASGPASLTTNAGAGNNISITSGDNLNLSSTNDITVTPSDDFNINAPDRFNIVANGVNATTVPYLDASKNFISSAVTPTQLGYLSGATGTTGTITSNLVFSASPALTGTPTAPTQSVGDSTTAIATTAFVDAAATSRGYVIQCYQQNVSAPADATTYYFGNQFTQIPAAGTKNYARVYVPKSGIIKSIYGVTAVLGTLGSAENSTVFFRLNDATNTTVSSTVTHNAVNNAYSNTALSISVVAGDFFEIGWTTPTWATNPTTCTQSLLIYIE